MQHWECGKDLVIWIVQGTFKFKESNMLHFSSFVCYFSRILCSLSVPILGTSRATHSSQDWDHGKGYLLGFFSVAPFNDFSASATLYLLDNPFCCNWWNFMLCNGWVIILQKIYKPAFLLIKYPCSTRDLGPRVILSFSLPLANSLDRRNLPSSRCCPDFQDLFKRTPCASVSGTSPVLGLYWFSL